MSLGFLKLSLLTALLFICPTTASWLNCPTAAAQSPVANRVRGVAESLPKGAREIARYTDERRHCLFYQKGDRLYKYDVVEGTNDDLTISPAGYTRLIGTWLSSNRRYIFVAIDREGLTATYLENGQELWRIDSYNGRKRKVGSGCRIRYRKSHETLEKPHFIISKAWRCLNRKAPLVSRNWMMRDHYFDFSDGESICITDEYRYGSTPATIPTLQKNEKMKK